MKEQQNTVTELARSYKDSIKLNELDNVGGRPIPNKPISPIEILKFIEANKNELPNNINYEFKNNVATVLITESGFYIEGTIIPTTDEFKFEFEYNILIPRVFIKKSLIEALAEVRDRINSETPNSDTVVILDYVRIKDVYANAHNFGFAVEWKLGPYKDILKVRGSTGLTSRWYTAWSGGVDGILKVKIKARLKTPNELCIKVEAKGPFGWKENHTECVKF
jgi:hypothetical protein